MFYMDSRDIKQAQIKLELHRNQHQKFELNFEDKIFISRWTSKRKTIYVLKDFFSLHFYEQARNDCEAHFLILKIKIVFCHFTITHFGKTNKIIRSDMGKKPDAIRGCFLMISAYFW